MELINYDFKIAPTNANGAPLSAEELEQVERQGLRDYLQSEYDPEAAERSYELYGKTPDVKSTIDRDFFVGHKMAKLGGYPHNPEMHWSIDGQMPQVPEGLKSREDMYEAIGSEAAAQALHEYKIAKEAENLILLEQRYREEINNPTTRTKQVEEPYLKKLATASQQGISAKDIELSGIIVLTGLLVTRLLANLYNMKQDKPFLITPHIIALLLLLAWLDMPYGYYMFLRLAVSIYAGYLFITHLDQKDSPQHELKLILAAALCILYQPLLKVPLERDIWQWVNLATVGVVYLIPPRKTPAQHANNKKH